MNRLVFYVLLIASTLWADQSAARTIGGIAFKACEIGTRGRPLTSAECAYLEVPEDPANANGRKIKIHLSLLPSHAKKPAIEPVIFLAGGPGQGASESYGQMAPGFREILKTHHVILYDQRGTGRSNSLQCEPSNEEDLPEDRALLAQLLGERTAACRDRLQAAVAPKQVDLRFYNTSVAITDLEAIRKALGTEQMNIYGISYGTRMAQQYAMNYPSHVRSLILDGVAPNELILGTDHARALDDALAQQFARCAADQACHARFGDPAKTLAELRQRFASQTESYQVADPLTGQFEERKTGPAVIAAVGRLSVYSSEYASLLPLWLDEANKGRPQALLAQSAMLMDNLQEQMADAMGLSVMCSEDAEFLKPNPEDQTRLLGTDLVDGILVQCKQWPKGARNKNFFEPLKGAVPTLLISGEYDPVTPARYGEQVLKNLTNAVHVVAPKQGHGNLFRGCIPKLAAQFVKQLQPKELDLSCVKKISPAPFFLDYTGPSP